MSVGPKLSLGQTGCEPFFVHVHAIYFECIQIDFLVLGIYNFGEGQKVVAFSFYGDPDSKRHDVRQYFNGIKLNLDALKRFYPGQVYSFAEKLPGENIS